MSKTKAKARATSLSNILSGLARSGALLSTSLLYGCATFLTKAGASSESSDTSPAELDAASVDVSDLKLSIAPKAADVQSQSGRLAVAYNPSELQPPIPAAPVPDTGSTKPPVVTPDVPSGTQPTPDPLPVKPPLVAPDIPKYTPPLPDPVPIKPPVVVPEVPNNPSNPHKSSSGGSTSGGGAGGAAPAPPAEVAITGKAINGYLSNALVFQDKNNNLALDLNEAVGITNASGDYSLTGKLEGSLVMKSIANADISELIIAANRLGLTKVVTAIQEGTSYIDSKSGLKVSYTGSMIAPIVGRKQTSRP